MPPFLHSTARASIAPVKKPQKISQVFATANSCTLIQYQEPHRGRLTPSFQNAAAQ